MLVLAFIMTVLVSVLATFFVARAYYGRKHATAVEPETAPQTPAPSGALAEQGAAVPENTQFAHIAELVRQEKLFLTPKFGRDELVRRFGLTNRQIGAIFSGAGTSVPEFIRDCRLEYAKNLITERPDLTFAEIAGASGFLHASTFNVDFKNKYGVTPTQYKENNIPHDAS